MYSERKKKIIKEFIIYILDKINYKIRQHSLAKIPAIMVVGKNEMQNNTVSLRKLGSDNQEILQFNESIDMLKTAILNKTSL
jgi:threonyl-tRNA synthetase